MGVIQAILSILSCCGDSLFHFKWIFPSISTEVCVFPQKEKATVKGWISILVLTTGLMEQEIRVFREE